MIHGKCVGGGNNEEADIRKIATIIHELHDYTNTPLGVINSLACTDDLVRKCELHPIKFFKKNVSEIFLDKYWIFNAPHFSELWAGSRLPFQGWLLYTRVYSQYNITSVSVQCMLH